LNLNDVGNKAMHSSLSATRASPRVLLAGATLDPEPAPAVFEIYRRTVAPGLTDLLAAHYPVTRQMMGEDSFATIARSYTLQFPPCSPGRADYGTSLPAFIRSRGRTTPSIEYLADIAELESARLRACHAADAVPVALDAFSRSLTIELHPSAALITSRFPVVSIWENNLRNDDTLPRWRPEAALIVRPEREVKVWRLPRGGYAFLTAIMDGHHLSDAARRAMEQDTNFDIDANVEILIEANACIGYYDPSPLA
jgi:hypothetical protein